MCIHILAQIKQSGLCYCPLVVAGLCCSVRKEPLPGGVEPAVAASGSNADMGLAGQSVFYSHSLLSIQVHHKHPRIPLTGQIDDGGKHSCEDQGDMPIAVEVHTLRAPPPLCNPRRLTQGNLPMDEFLFPTGHTPAHLSGAAWDSPAAPKCDIRTPCGMQDDSRVHPDEWLTFQLLGV